MDRNIKFEERLELSRNNIKQDLQALLFMCEKLFTEEFVSKISEENYKALNFYLTACALCVNDKLESIDICYDAVNMMFSAIGTLEPYAELEDDKKLIEIGYKLSAMNFANLLYCAIMDRNEGKGKMQINEQVVESISNVDDIIKRIMGSNKHHKDIKNEEYYEDGEHCEDDEEDLERMLEDF